MGIESLRSLCAEQNKPIHFALFERLVLAEDDAKPSYAALAKEHRITVTDVTNYLAYARREFRRNVLVHLRAITATEEEFKSEARALPGCRARRAVTAEAGASAHPYDGVRTTTGDAARDRNTLGGALPSTGRLQTSAPCL